MINKELINADALTAAVYVMGDDVIGQKTLIEELVEVGRLTDRAELILCKNYYSRTYQMLRQEFTEEELKGEAVRSIKNAAKKLLFVNSAVGERFRFITKKIDKADVGQLYGLLKSYQFNICCWNV